MKESTIKAFMLYYPPENAIVIVFRGTYTMESTKFDQDDELIPYQYLYLQ